MNVLANATLEDMLLLMRVPGKDVSVERLQQTVDFITIADRMPPVGSTSILPLVLRAEQRNVREYPLPCHFELNPFDGLSSIRLAILSSDVSTWTEHAPTQTVTRHNFRFVYRTDQQSENWWSGAHGQRLVPVRFGQR